MDLGYARVSTTKQDLQRQIDALTRAGVPAERIYVDKKSGASTDRPGLAALLDYARPGDVIVVHTLDRLGRTVRDTLNLIHDLTERGIGLRNLADPVRVDTTDPGDLMGQLAIVLLALFAQMERTYTLERVAHARSVAEATGRRPGRPSTLDASKLAWAVHLRDVDGLDIAEIVEKTKIPRSSLYRHLPPRPDPAVTASGQPASARTDTFQQTAADATGAVAGSQVGTPLAAAAGAPSPTRPPAPVPRPQVPDRQAPGQVHIPAGFLPAGAKVKAACTCGWTTRPRPDEQRALATLETQHGYQAETCQLCGRDRRDGLPHSDRYRHLQVITDPETGEQFLACADDRQGCRDAGARRQLELDQAAALGTDLPRPPLRLVRQPSSAAPADREAAHARLADPQHQQEAATEAGAASLAGAAGARAVDLSDQFGDPAGTWLLMDAGEGSWHLHHADARVGVVRRESTTRGRRGWSARLDTGVPLPAHGDLATTVGSNLWRTRDLAAAAIARRIVSRKPPRWPR